MYDSSCNYLFFSLILSPLLSLSILIQYPQGRMICQEIDKAWKEKRKRLWITWTAGQEIFSEGKKERKRPWITWTAGQEIYREGKEERMRPNITWTSGQQIDREGKEEKERHQTLHELPVTEMVKSETVRLASGSGSDMSLADERHPPIPPYHPPTPSHPPPPPILPLRPIV